MVRVGDTVVLHRDEVAEPVRVTGFNPDRSHGGATGFDFVPSRAISVGTYFAEEPDGGYREIRVTRVHLELADGSPAPLGAHVAIRGSAEYAGPHPAVEESPGTTPRVRSLVDLFHERLRSSRDARAATFRIGEVWTHATWAEIGDRVDRVAQALLAMGIQPGDRVAIFAATSLDWCVADLAILSAGGVTVPIYASNSVDECQFVLRDAGVKAVFVDGGHRGLARLANLVRACQGLSPPPLLIAFDSLESPVAEGAVALRELEKEGGAFALEHPEELRRRRAALAPEVPAGVIYTSGTTGTPKGVVLTHGAWLYEAEAVAQLELLRVEDVVLLFLPLAHSFGKLVTAAWLRLGFTMAFCEGPERLMDSLTEVSPTVLPAVPRVFEKVYFGILRKALATPGLRGWMVARALKEFDAYAAARASGRPYSSLQFSLAKATVFKEIAASLRERLGGQMRLFVSGSAPLASKIGYFFELNGLVILEGYGLTETSAAATGNRIAQRKLGTAGLPLPGTEIKLAADGEVLIKGPGVMKEYLHLPEATREAFTPEGWLRTGDLGAIDGDGFLRIVDRRKDLIKTAGGEYVSPQRLESGLLNCPLISQALAHGDRRKYITALVTVSEEAAREYLKGQGRNQPRSYAELSQDPAVQAEIQRAVNRLNSTLPAYAAVRRFRVLDRELTLEKGELTPTFKVKRSLVARRFQGLLDSMYVANEPPPAGPPKQARPAPPAGAPHSVA